MDIIDDYVDHATVTVASGKRIFSKLKLIKTYRITLTSRAVLNMGNAIAQHLDLSEVINMFTDKKAKWILISFSVSSLLL